ncbi:preprotein translocase subunit SecE [Candidatus Saccharibacteria bacterium TM7i]|nr:preprotein translocase subunit SecE [Candidatus Saccharibacteria bacterium TM7i]
MAEKSKVTRIKATDDTPKEAKVSRKEKRAAKKMQIEKPYSKHWYVRFFQRIGRYFKGSWVELKQVRWPTRKATWSLTVAVVIFSGFFVGLIMLLDLGFNALFELIISK